MPESISMWPIWTFLCLYLISGVAVFVSRRLRSQLEDYSHALNFLRTLSGIGVFLSLTYSVWIFNTASTHEMERHAASRLSSLRALESELYSNLLTTSSLLANREKYESALTTPDTELHFIMLENILTQGYISDRPLRKALLDAQHRMILVNNGLDRALDLSLSRPTSQDAIEWRHNMLVHLLTTAMKDLELTQLHIKKIFTLCPEFQQEASTTYSFVKPDPEAREPANGEE